MKPDRAVLPSCLVAATMIIACYTSPAPQSHRLIRSPAGATIAVVVHGVQRDTQRTGELLEFRDDRLLLLTETGLVGVSPAALTVLRAPSVGHNVVRKFDRPEKLGWLRLASRFPYGIPSAVLDSLLKSANQTEIAVLRPATPR